jgi:basic membrane protein A
MPSTGPLRYLAVAVVATAVLAACGDNTDAGSAGSTDPAAAAGPDVDGDGEVVVGVLSPGDLDDNGYYESFVAQAQRFVDGRDDWRLVEVGSVDPAEALGQARNLCRQGVDMVALAAADLADAIPASAEDVCADTVWYVPSSGNVESTDRIVVSQDDPEEVLLAAGYALGLLMEASGATTAGFVTGPEADYSTVAARAFRAGIRQLVPDADVVTTFTGEFDDSGLAVEATRAQLDQGIGGLYPYLGGATDAAAQLGVDAGVPVLTPGTDRCEEGSFAIAVVFDPGEYFAAALTDFADGELRPGTTRAWRLGIDEVPTVRFCGAAGATPEQEQRLAHFIASIGDGAVDPGAEIERLGR